VCSTIDRIISKRQPFANPTYKSKKKTAGGLKPRKHTVMQKQTPPTFSVNLNPNPGLTRYGKRRPNGKGWIAKPGQPDRKFNVSLWASTFVNKDGVELLAYNGNVDAFSRTDRGLDKQRAGANAGAGPSVEVNGMEVQDGRVVLFEALHAEGYIAENGNRRADFYGYWNDKGQIVDIGGWANDFEDERGGTRTSVVGGTQPHYENPLDVTASQDEIDAMRSTAEQAEEPSFTHDSENPAPAEEASSRRRGRRSEPQQTASIADDEHSR